MAGGTSAENSENSETLSRQEPSNFSILQGNRNDVNKEMSVLATDAGGTVRMLSTSLSDLLSHHQFLSAVEAIFLPVLQQYDGLPSLEFSLGGEAVLGGRLRDLLLSLGPALLQLRALDDRLEDHRTALTNSEMVHSAALSTGLFRLEGAIEHATGQLLFLQQEVAAIQRSRLSPPAQGTDLALDSPAYVALRTELSQMFTAQFVERVTPRNYKHEQDLYQSFMTEVLACNDRQDHERAQELSLLHAEISSLAERLIVQESLVRPSGPVGDGVDQEQEDLGLAMAHSEIITALVNRLGVQENKLQALKKNWLAKHLQVTNEVLHAKVHALNPLLQHVDSLAVQVRNLGQENPLFAGIQSDVRRVEVDFTGLRSQLEDVEARIWEVEQGEHRAIEGTRDQISSLAGDIAQLAAGLAESQANERSLKDQVEALRAAGESRDLQFQELCSSLQGRIDLLQNAMDSSGRPAAPGPLVPPSRGPEYGGIRRPPTLSTATRLRNFETDAMRHGSIRGRVLTSDMLDYLVPAHYRAFLDTVPLEAVVPLIGVQNIFETNSNRTRYTYVPLLPGISQELTFGRYVVLINFELEERVAVVGTPLLEAGPGPNGTFYLKLPLEPFSRGGEVGPISAGRLLGVAYALPADDSSTSSYSPSPSAHVSSGSSLSPGSPSRNGSQGGGAAGHRQDTPWRGGNGQSGGGGVDNGGGDEGGDGGGGDDGDDPSLWRQMQRASSPDSRFSRGSGDVGEPKRFDNKAYGSLKNAVLARDDLRIRFSLDDFSPPAMIHRWLSFVMLLPEAVPYDLQSPANSQYTKTLMLLCLEEPLRSAIPPEDEKMLLGRPWQQYTLHEFDTVSNRFKCSHDNKKPPIWEEGSFVYDLLAKLEENHHYFPKEEVQLKLGEFYTVGVDSTRLFNDTAIKILKACTHSSRLYNPETVYQTIKRSLSDALQMSHSKHDMDTQSNPRKRAPRHTEFSSNLAPITWVCVDELLTWVNSNLKLAVNRPSKVPTSPSPAGRATTSTPVATTKEKSARGLVASITDLGDSDTPSYASNTLSVNLATLESIDEKLQRTQNAVLKLTDTSAQTSVKLAEISHQVNHLHDGNIQRDRELGSLHPSPASMQRQYSFTPGGRNPSRSLTFSDDKDVPTGPSRGAGAGRPFGTSPASGGGAVRQSGIRPTGGTSSPGHVSEAALRELISTAPPNSCYAFLRGNCTRANCKFTHWKPDVGLSSTLTAAIVMVDECEDNSATLEEFSAAISVAMVASPILGVFVSSILEDTDAAQRGQKE